METPVRAELSPLFWEILVFGIVGLGIQAVYVFQHRLMWKDYVKRHRMNGSDDKAVG